MIAASSLSSPATFVALQQVAEPFTVEGAGAAWRGLLAVMVVLGLVSLLAWLVRRGHLPIGARGARGGIAVESAVPLGERRSLVVVTVEGRRLLLGLTPMQVSLVTELGPAPGRNETGFGFHLEQAKAQEPRA